MPLRVMVLESSPAIQGLVRASLEERGYEVECTGTAALGWRSLLRQRPHLLILDVGLPDENGLHLLRRLRALHGPEAYPVLVISNKGEEADILLGYESGANEYLTKPFAREVLLAKCAVLIARSAALRETTGERSENHRELLFDRYRAHGVLGRGAFGVVYLADDLKQRGKEVALKVSGPEHARDPEQRLRFLREAYALSSLKDPSIVKVHDFGLFADQLYLAMECVRGPTLRGYVDRHGPLSETEARGLLRALAHALGALTRIDLVHRDLKPANIILRDGQPLQPVLVDFGLAKRVREPSVTAKSTIVGTPAYMAPEIFLGEGADHRSDLFSLGLVIAYALTGHSVFPSLSGVPLLMRIARGGIPLPECRDASLKAVLEGLVEPDRDRRISSGEALIALLEGAEVAA